MLFSTMLKRSHGVLYLRRVVPAKLRDIIGKREIRISLKTRDPELGKRRLKVESLKVDALFDAARRGIIGALSATLDRSRMTEEEIEITRDYFVDKLVADDQGERRLSPVEKARYLAFVSSSADNPPLSVIWEKWRQERQPSSKLWAEWSTVLRRFTSIALEGVDMPIRDITKAHVRTFKAKLLATPARRKKGSTLSAASVAKNLGALRSVLAWAMAQGYIDLNPADGLTAVAGPKNGGEKARLPYSPGDLKRIFSEERKGAANYWLPYLALYTGARLEELAQLRVVDVKTDDGVAYLDIHGRDGRRIKTRSSERKVPLHPELLRLGFLQYVEGQRKAGHERVSSTLEQDTHGSWSGAWSKWYGRHLRSLGITDRRLTFHSFRHTMKDALRAARVPDAEQRAILGHSGVGVADGYGIGFPLTVLTESMAKVRYPGVSVEGLSRA
jgi:integrase